MTSALEELNKLFESFINVQEFNKTYLTESLDIGQAHNQLRLLADNAEKILNDMVNPRIDNQRDFAQAEKLILRTFQYLKVIKQYVDGAYLTAKRNKQKNPTMPDAQSGIDTLRQYDRIHKNAIKIIQRDLNTIKNKISKNGFVFYHSFGKGPLRPIADTELTVDTYRAFARAIKVA